MAIQLTEPDRLGPYRLLDRIGEGGMGVVHLATDPENRLVAIKVLRPHAAGATTARQRLAREVETMRRVRSPFVADVMDADVTGDMPYIVTRFVPGHTLDDVVVRHGPLTGTRLQRMAFGLASALAAVHAAGIVHRDLKPGNVMMVGDNPVVIDFGIAQAADSTRLTETGMFMGTPGYLAPEVIEGEPAAPASDVHSWAATVAFAARGEAPYGTGTYEAVFFRILRGDANLDGIPAALYPVIAAALQREPARRPTAAWLASQVARLDLTVPGAAHPAARPGPVAAGLAAPGVAAPGVAAPETVAPRAAVPHAVAAGTLGPGAVAAAAAHPGLPGAAVAGAAVSGAAGAAAAATHAAGPAADHRQPGGAAGAGYRAPTGQPAYRQARDVADLLPPVRYTRGGGRPEQATAGAAGPGGTGRARPAPRRHRVLALATLVIAVATSVVLPVAGTVAILAVIALLRAADRARNGLAIRRSVRGPRAIDPLLVAVSAPWALARSVLAMIMVAPLLLVASGAAAVAAIVALGSSQLPLAAACGAGIYMALSCCGPASRGPRRQLHRTLDAIARTRLTAATATVVLGSLAAAMVSLALLRAPAFWPVPDPHSLLAHLPGAGLIHDGTLRLQHVGHGLARRIRVL